MTHTFAILDVAPETFADVCNRLTGLGVIREYLADDGAERPVIVLGTVALRAESQSPESRVQSPELGLAERPLVELVEVPIYDSLTLPADMRAALALSPWQRVENGRRCFAHELAGVLIGYAIVCGDMGFKEGTGRRWRRPRRKL